jgi:signal transduction histidine kinase
LIKGSTVATTAHTLALPQEKRAAPLFISMLRAILRAPLVLKVMGANALIAAVVLLLLNTGRWSTEQSAIVVILSALGVAYVVNLLLVRLALSPVKELERVAGLVSDGQFGVRAQPSLVADSQLTHLTDTVNSLLDSLAAERKRIQKLGAEVVSAQDTERARISRELHDSIAQTLAAVRFQLSAAGAATPDDDMRNRLSAARGMIGKAMDEVRNISQLLHPRVAEDLGLVSALEALAHQVEDRGRLLVRVVNDLNERAVPPKVAATLFRVAQESLRAAEKKIPAGEIDIHVYDKAATICLEIKHDTGRVDIGSADTDNSTAGLLSIMDRVELSGGVMRVEKGRDGTERVTAELDATEGIK